MRRLVVAVSLWIAGLVGLMPPGLCACWLMVEPGLHHPHLDGRPEHPHRHDYLFEMFQSQTTAVAPLSLTPLALLLALLAANALWRRLAALTQPAAGWVCAPLTPPPRY